MMLDPHSPQLVGFFDLPVDSLKVETLIHLMYFTRTSLSNNVFLKNDNFVLTNMRTYIYKIFKFYK